MNQPLRVLIVGDSTDDALLVERELRKGGYAVTSQRVETAGTMLAALEQQPWDLVICDLVLPGFNSLAALKLLQQQGLDLPFIIVSGRIDEDVAVAAMKAGAHDFLKKDRLARLLPAVARELHEAEDRRQRNQAAKALGEANELNRQIIASALEGIIVYGRDLRYQIWNPFMEQLTGVPAKDVVGRLPMEVFPFLGETGVIKTLENVLRGEPPKPLEYPYYITQNGRSGWMSDIHAPLRNMEEEIVGIISTVREITERKEAEEQLKALVREKEAMLREIHHRVKNNMQVISSLMHLQAGCIDHPAAKIVLRDMQDRVHSMTIIHEYLYSSQNLSAVDMAAYLKQLCQRLFRTLVMTPGTIQLRLELAPVQMAIDQAIPCGLIVNELVTNCFKHAFPDQAGGEVRIALQPETLNRVRMQVSDTGVGLPMDFNPGRSTTLGLQLVSDLTRQLQGTLEISPPGQAARFIMVFPLAA